MKICGRDIKVEGRVIRIARIHGDRYRFIDDPVPMIEGLRKTDNRIDIFTFMQKLPDTVPKHSYPMEWDNMAALPVSTFDVWWKEQVDRKTRNMVRKAEKTGIETREVPFDDALVHGISAIYNESPVRQGRRFRHYGKDIDTVRREHATFLDSSIFIGAFLDSTLIGFTKLTCDETLTEAGMMNIVSMIQHRDKCPTNALIAQAVRACAQRKIPYLVYASFAYGKKERDGLTDFKQNNGFQRVNLPRYYVPLTSIGWLARQLGLHHRFVDHLPESVEARLRQLRKTWVNRKIFGASEASS